MADGFSCELCGRYESDHIERDGLDPEMLRDLEAVHGKVSRNLLGLDLVSCGYVPTKREKVYQIRHGLGLLTPQQEELGADAAGVFTRKFMRWREDLKRAVAAGASCGLVRD